MLILLIVKLNCLEVTYSDIANRTLATAALVGIKGNLDLMYTRKDTLISGNGTTYLGLVLKHKFSQIIPQIDATTAGYNIKEISANIDSHNPAADMELSGEQLQNVQVQQEMLISILQDGYNGSKRRSCTY